MQELQPFDKCELDALLNERGPTGPAWELFDRWLRWWRHHHDDERSDYELIDDYLAWSRDKEKQA